MKGFVIATGEFSSVILGGANHIIKPFIGITSDEFEMRSGAGILSKKGGYTFFELQDDAFSVLRLWRVMKLLGMVKKLNLNTVDACYQIMSRETKDFTSRECVNVSRQFGGPQEFYKIREELIASSPTINDLEGILVELSLGGGRIDHLELESEITLCDIQLTPTIGHALKNWRQFSEEMRYKKLLEDSASQPTRH